MLRTLFSEKERKIENVLLFDKKTWDGVFCVLQVHESGGHVLGYFAQRKEALSFVAGDDHLLKSFCMSTSYCYQSQNKDFKLYDVHDYPLFEFYAGAFC